MTETTKPTSMPNQRLRYERERRCWSQQELADQLGTTPLNISRWERGITFPGPHFRQKLCELFEKSAQELGLVPENADDGKPAEPSPASGISPVPPPPPETPASLWNVPYRRNLFFTGREEIISYLRTALTSEGQPIALTQPQAISGLGGIGKTQTAVEYAYRYRESYNAVFWARADSHDLLVSDFLLTAALLNLPECNEQDQSLVVNAVIRWFSSHEHWLLILDNADNLEMVSEFIPTVGKGHILLTTRAQATGTVAQPIEMEKMELEEGILFLLRRTKLFKGNTSLETVAAVVRSQAQAIVEVVDGLPLALDQAGAYIEETGCSLADYLKFYKTRRIRLLSMRGRDVSGHPEPVATTWSLSFEEIERTNPAAAELLRLCAFLHPDAIPESMIVEGASELGPVLQLVAEDELELNEAIGELLKYSLVRREPEAKILSIHRLVQAVLKDGMDKETQRLWAERTVRLVNRTFPEVEFATWPKCQQYLPHAQVCAELIEQWEMMFAEAPELLNNAGRYLREREQYAEAKTFFQRALTIREQVMRLTHPDVAQSLNDLAVLYYTQGKYTEAEPLFQRALRIRERRLGPEHPDTARILNNLAVLYRAQGKYTEAESLFRRALAIRKQHLGPEHPDTAQSLNDLATLYRVQDKYKEAEPLCQQALAIRERHLGSNHPDTAQTLNNLAALYRVQGRYSEAEPLFHRTLAIRERQLGPDHHDTAQSLNDLAVLYHDQGRYSEAEPLYQQSLMICEQHLGFDHPDVSHSLNNLALLYHAQGKYTQAEPLFQRALAIREHHLGSGHPKTVMTLESYAALLRKIGREMEAAALESRARAIRAKQT